MTRHKIKQIFVLPSLLKTFFKLIPKYHLKLKILVAALNCRALPGLSLLLALPKRRQKASASSLGDPPTACRLNGTKLAFGSDNIPFHAVCTGWVPRLRNLCAEPQCDAKCFKDDYPRQASASAVSKRTGYPPGAGGVE
ncbi:hypothetical protein D0T84_20350 [Dysgonomonas sp. 521]|nr:hypothetical protein [Dysgonomonas sp. 521]